MRSRGLCALGAVALLGAVTPSSTLAQPPRLGQDFQLLERGRYLTLLADCAACHTDPAQGHAFAGGRRIETPFGTMVAPNITPDRETGIGQWSDAQFEAAVRNGHLPSGARLYPAMPYEYYTRMRPDEVRAIRAYLATIPPVHNAVHSNQLPFPFNIRALMWFWDLLYFRAGVFEPDPARTALLNRGAYLVTGPGHCGACHTPKNLLGADKNRRSLRGYSVQGWFAPNITNDAARGLGRWSIEDVVYYLRTGHNRFFAASGPMAEEVEDSSSQMTEADLTAIATYLKAGAPSSPAATPLAASDPRMVAGAAIYSDLCSACHAPDGRGVPYLIPSLAGSSSIASRESTSLLRVVLLGAPSAATGPEPTGAAMPGYRAQLNDQEIAAVITYLRNSWGHAAAAVSARQVRKARAAVRTQ